jgi:hypothetical protein
MQERFVHGALGHGDVAVEGFGEPEDAGFANVALVAFQGSLRAEPMMIGVSSPGKSYLDRSSRTSISTSSRSSASSTMSALFM